MFIYGKANSLVPEVDEFVDKWKQTISKKLKENNIEQPVNKKSYDDII